MPAANNQFLPCCSRSKPARLLLARCVDPSGSKVRRRARNRASAFRGIVVGRILMDDVDGTAVVAERARLLALRARLPREIANDDRPRAAPPTASRPLPAQSRSIQRPGISRTIRSRRSGSLSRAPRAAAAVCRSASLVSRPPSGESGSAVVSRPSPECEPLMSLAQASIRERRLRRARSSPSACSMMLSHIPDLLSHAWLPLCAVVLDPSRGDQNEFFFGTQLV